MVQFSNFVFPASVFTATGQTSTTIDLSPNQAGANGAYSAGALSVVGAGLATATFQVLGSSDGGQNFFALNVAPATSPTSTSTTTTVTVNGLYYVDLAAITHIKIATSGTFTATSLSIQLTGSPNGSVVENSGSGTGTVTSFSAGALSPLFTSSVATSTTTPALTFTLDNAAQNSVLAGPSTGGTGAPSYRALVAADLPGSYLPLSGGTLTGALSGTSASFTGALSAATLTAAALTNSIGISNTYGSLSIEVLSNGVVYFASGAGFSLNSGLTLPTTASGYSLTVTGSVANTNASAQFIANGYGHSFFTLYRGAGASGYTAALQIGDVVGTTPTARWTLGEIASTDFRLLNSGTGNYSIDVNISTDLVSLPYGVATATINLTAAAPTTTTGQLGLGSTTSATATAGSATLPGFPVGFLIANLAGTAIKIPYYAN